MDSKYMLEMKDIVKNFAGVQALKGVQFNVKPGEVHALTGENGAGKSTLMKCLIGIHPPTSGDMIFCGKKIDPRTTNDSLDLGISMIHQELNPVESRPIMENVWLGREPRNKLGLVDHRKMYKMTKELLATIEMYEDPKTQMGKLTVAKMQMIEIAKAISYDAKLIIMDEPTSALTESEVKQLFKIIRKLKSENKAIVYISHKMDEIYTITDTISVFRDGEYVDTKPTSELPLQELINLMVGREITEMFPKVKCPIGDVYLDVQDLSHGKDFKNVSFQVRRGEILGFAGLVGAGRTEVMETIFGVRKKTSGKVFIDGKEVTINSPRDAIKNKIALLTEDRRRDGIFPVLDILNNTAIANIGKYTSKVGLLKKALMKADALEYKDKLAIKTPSLQQRIMNLSGGNQQKVLVARWMLTLPEILILDEPTRGIDVGAKAEIHKLVTMLAGEGKCIIMISSELPEVLGMSDRVVVMHEGKVTGILENNELLTQEVIMGYAAAVVD